MSELTDLYQELIVDHGRRPRNFRSHEHPTHQADGHNPLCGDRLTLFVEVSDGVVKDLCFQGSGCAISTASASLMTDSLRGKSLGEATRIFEAFHALTTGQEPPVEAASLGKLKALAGVRAFPMRVKCATLAWHTYQRAIEGGERPASTE
jgi:nitrogen fixation protein NifU and related proteins